MNILIVAPQPYYVERGTPIAVRQLARTLVLHGHELHLLTYPIGDDPRDEGLTLHRSAPVPFVKKIPIGFSLKKLMLDVPISFSIFRLYFRYRFDVIHAVEESVYPALLLKLVSNVRVIYDMDSSLADQLTNAKRWLRPARRVLEWFEGLAIRRSDTVSPVCDELVQIARRHKPAASVFALYDVPNSGDENDLADQDVEQLSVLAPSNSLIGLYIGNLEAYQGIDLLLESIHLIPAEHNIYTIIIGGNDDHIAHYQIKSRDLGIFDNVCFLGPRPLAHLKNLLTQADMLYSPRVTGGNTPMKLYSYMAAERPIVATNLSTHTQVLDDQTAVLTNPTPKSYSQGILRLSKEPELSKNIARNARELVFRKYSSKNYEESLKNMYNSLA